MPRPSGFVPLSIALLLGAGCSKFGAGEAPSFKAATVAKTDILSSIEATGTLEPEDVVDIGAQVTGQILSFGSGADGHGLDYGSKVEAGQLMAKIDDIPYALAKAQAEAQLASAQAAVRVAEANVLRDAAAVAQNEARAQQAQAQLAQAARDWDRAQKVGTASGAFTQVAFDTARGVFEAAEAALKASNATTEVARAQAKASEAAVAQAQSAVAQAKVAVALADRNLGYCVIASPIKGVVIDRRVDVGQTVVSNLNASSLFLLAKDLSKMQVWAPVNEADIGGVFPGQNVAFSVDAVPGRTFKGAVERVRLNAAMTQNVVTYTVEIAVDNADGALMPYLTANVKFELAKREGVLAVPNAALRWKPQAEQVAPGGEPKAAPESAHEGGAEAKSEGNSEAKPYGKTKGKKRRSAVASLWVRDTADPAKVRAVAVRTGISDGVVTEVTPVVDGALIEGMEVILGENRAAPEAAGGSNPFAPQMPRMRGAR